MKHHAYFIDDLPNRYRQLLDEYNNEYVEVHYIEMLKHFLNQSNEDLIYYEEHDLTYLKWYREMRKMYRKTIKTLCRLLKYHVKHS